MIPQLGYPNMTRLLEPAELGDFTLEHITLTESHVKLEKLRARINPQRFDASRCLRAGDYVVLRNKKTTEILMSDTWMERFTCNIVCQKAHGHVLIFGMGIGLILTKILKKPSVKSVYIVEKEPDVVRLVWTQLIKSKFFTKEELHKVTFFFQDIKTFNSCLRFDTIWIDIDSYLGYETKLRGGYYKHKFQKLLNKENGWIGYWLEGIPMRRNP